MYAFALEGYPDGESREEFDTWLWSDPAREARIRAALGLL